MRIVLFAGSDAGATRGRGVRPLCSLLHRQQQAHVQCGDWGGDWGPGTQPGTQPGSRPSVQHADDPPGGCQHPAGPDLNF